MHLIHPLVGCDDAIVRKASSKLFASVQALLSTESGEVLPKVDVPAVQPPVKMRWPFPVRTTALLVLAALVIINGGVWAITRNGSETSNLVSTAALDPSEAVSLIEALVTEEVEIAATEISHTPEGVENKYP